MILKYKNLETKIDIDLTSMGIIKNLAGGFIRDANLQADETLIYNEIIDESLIEYIAETPEETIFILNQNLEIKKPATKDEENKLKARGRIALEIGDIYDLYSDLSKRVTMLERLTIRLSNDLITFSPENVPVVKAAYSEFIGRYLATQAAYNDVTSMADLEDSDVLFAKLFERSIKTTQIIKEEYIDKKEIEETTE